MTVPTKPDGRDNEVLSRSDETRAEDETRTEDEIRADEEARADEDRADTTDRTGEAEDWTDDDRTAEDRTEEERAAQERADEDRADDRTDEDRADEDRADEDRADEERIAAHRVDEDWTDEDRDAADRAEADRDEADRVGVTPDVPPVEPAPVPTAFGAATVGGAVAASAMADERDRRDRSTLGDSPVIEDQDRRADGTEVAEPLPTGHAVGVASVDQAREERREAAEEGTAEPGEPAPTVGETAAPVDVAVPVDTAAEEADERPEELLPGAVPAEPVTTLWDESTAQTFRVRWREVQLRFVDDPHGATDEAQALVTEVVDSLTAALVEQRTDLDGWRSGEGQDTEHMRVALRRYRDFFDRLLSR